MDETRNQRIDKLGEMPVWPGNSGPTLSDNLRVEPQEQAAPTADDTDSSTEEAGESKVRIPRSRLKTLTEKAAALEREQQEMQRAYEERLAALEARLQGVSQTSDELPPEWIELHGDSDVSKAAYRATRELTKKEFSAWMEEQNRERAAQEEANRERLQAIEQSFDMQMSDLEASLGRELTDTQKAEILEVVEKYSPRNPQEPDLYESYLSIDSAYEIWQNSHKPDARKIEMARIAGTVSSGAGSNTDSNMSIDQVRNWRSRYRHLGL